MPDHPFVSHLRGRAGSKLRTIARYDREGYEFVYIRDDLDPSNIQRWSDSLARRMEGESSFVDSEALRALGDERATVHIRELAVLMRFPTSEDEGFFVTLEPKAATDLHEFVMECVERLEGDSPSLPDGV